MITYLLCFSLSSVRHFGVCWLHFDMTLKFYFDSLSQPCRAVEIFLKVNHIPYVPKYLSIAEGKHLSDDFSKINPFNKLPAVDHNGKCLMESIAIIRYLSKEYEIDDHWYPKDNYKQAKVDEYLEWHHLGLRLPSYNYVWYKTLHPLMGNPKSPGKVQYMKKKISDACDSINNIWLKNEPFLAGSKISVADLLAATEIEQLVLTDFNPKDGRPALAEWLTKVRRLSNPHYDDVHSALFEFKKSISSHL